MSAFVFSLNNFVQQNELGPILTRDTTTPIDRNMEEKGIFQEAAEFAEGLANGNIQLTDEERRRERRVKWKTDLIILPLLATVYFLASMVCAIFRSTVLALH